VGKRKSADKAARGVEFRKRREKGEERLRWSIEEVYRKARVHGEVNEKPNPKPKINKGQNLKSILY